MHGDNWEEIPRMETPRLWLRALRADDSDDVYAYAANPRVAGGTAWDPHANRGVSQTVVAEILRHYAGGAYFCWAIEEKRSRRVIGTCGFDDHWDLRDQRARLAYVLAQDYWGRGFMVEAARRVLLFGFEQLGLHRVTARCLADNRQSERVLQKLGMTYEGMLWDHVRIKGRFRTVKCYGTLSHEFLAKGSRDSAGADFLLG